jgi:hypothetical protein
MLGLRVTSFSQLVKTLRVDPVVLQFSGIGEQEATGAQPIAHPVVGEDDSLSIVLMPMRTFP